MKRIFLFTLVLVLLLNVSALAQAETPSPAGQYYTYSYTADGYGDYIFYFHFYETDPVLGAVYYAGFSNNMTAFAGLYKVEEAPYDYACQIDRDSTVSGAEPVSGTAPYTITFFDWDGNAVDECGWDGEVLYNDCETIHAYGSGPVLYHLDADGAFQSAYDGEVGVSYVDFVVVDDPTSTVSLCHDMSYVDMMMYFIDGTWALSYAEDGSAVYALTPFDESEQPATLTAAPDKQTAVYTDSYGDGFDMINVEATGPKLTYIGEGSFYLAAASADAALVLDMYDDGNCELSVSAFGSVQALDTGTYTVNADYSISFTFDGAGKLTAALNMETRSIALQYVNENTSVGALDAELTIGSAE